MRTSSILFFSTPGVLLFFVCFLFVTFRNESTRRYFARDKTDTSSYATTKVTVTLEFIPKRPVISCNDLFTDSGISQFNMSKSFRQLYNEFHAEVNNSVGGRKGPVAGYFDGHSFLLPEQYKALHYMAQQPFVQTVCETGFNYGHSSFNFLTANEKAVVHSFDIGHHGHAKYMANYLTRKFPNRFFIHFGDSTQTIPELIQKNPQIQCDFMFVDGSHSYPVAKSDLENFLKIAGSINLIAMDDYPTISGRKYGQSWEELVAAGKIEELMRCKFNDIVNKHTSEAGFVIGSGKKDSK